MSIWMPGMARSEGRGYIPWLRRQARWQVAYVECLVEGRDVSLAPKVWVALNQPMQGELNV